MIGEFSTGEMRRGDIEDWLIETITKESAEKDKEQATILRRLWLARHSRRRCYDYYRPDKVSPATRRYTAN